MSTTITFTNYGTRPFAYPQAGNIPADPTAPKTVTLPTVDVDSYNVDVLAVARFGVVMEVGGVAPANVVELSATGTIADDDNVVLATVGGTDVTLTLPALANVELGHEVYIYLVSKGAGDLIIEGNASETVLGAANQTIDVQGAYLRLEKESDTNWKAYDI